MNASSESLPPPPAYLLDSTGRTSPGKVGETVKALTELNHMPASPSVLRRNVSQISPTPPQVSTIRITNRERLLKNEEPLSDKAHVELFLAFIFQT